jgi:hypothetical protein
MRIIIMLLLCLVGVLIATNICLAQSHSEKISKEFVFERKAENNTLLVANINGNITVQGYDGEKILVEVNKSIKAKTEARLEKGKKELAIGVIDNADTIILYLDGLCNAFGKNSKNNWNRKRASGWGYDWSGCDQGKDWHTREGYNYKVDFTIKVPARINVVLSTVNDGDIHVENVNGIVVADNVNGSIKLINLSSAVKAHTINGNVDLNFIKNPTQECRFYTLNGDITAWFKKGLAANMSFDSFNGSFYTNVQKLDALPVEVEKKSEENGVKYKVNGNRFKIGDGGVLLDFETFNGNVYVKEKEN